MAELTGYHWIYQGEDVRSRDRAQICGLMHHLVNATGLNPIAPLQLDCAADGHTWSAAQLIAESHITVHAIGRRVWADVFSCRPFDAETVGSVLRICLEGKWLGRQVRPQEELTLR